MLVVTQQNTQTMKCIKFSQRTITQFHAAWKKKDKDK